MWLKEACAEEIICRREREAGGFWKSLLGALGASECHSCRVISRRVLECTAEVKSRGKAGAENSTLQQIDAVHFMWPRQSGHSFCLPPLNRAVRSNHDTSTELTDGYVVLWPLPLTRPLSLTVNNTLPARKGRLEVDSLSPQTDLCLHLLF